MTSLIVRRPLLRSASLGTAAAATALLAACGGGGDGGGAGPTAPPPAAYITWNGSGNGDVVVDRSNDRFRVRAGDGVVESLTGSAMNGLRVRNAVLESNNVPIGSVTLVPSTGGGQIAGFRCNNGALADIVFGANNTYTVDCAAPGPAPAPAPAPPPAPPAPPPSSGYINWNGSANGSVVLDRDNERFQVRTGGQVETASGTALNGLVVSGSTVVYGGSSVGSVALVAGSGGGNVAAFRCSNGSLLDIRIASGQYTIDCGSPPSAPPPPPAPGYVTWSGSANGEFIVDNSGDLFRVRSDNGEVIDQSNARLLNTRVVGSTLSINGSAVASVTFVRSTTGQRIVGFVCGNGRYLEIYDVSATQFRYTCDGTRIPAPA